MKQKITRVQKYNTEEIDIQDIPYPIEEEETTSKHPLLSKIFIYFILISIAIIAYSSLIAPRYIDIKELKIENKDIPESISGLKIVQFSDIHYGNSIDKKQLDKIVKRINSLKPDVIVFTGDLISKDVQINDEIKEEIISSLNNLECNLFKYAIYGDEDNEQYEEIMINSDFYLLDNTSKLLYYKDIDPIVITGIGPKNKQNYSTLNKAVNDTDIIGYYQIVLIHEPDTVDNFIDYRPNLVLAGHTLGGSIKLPFLKPLFLPEDSLKYYKDHYTVLDTELYISNGLGTSSLNARFNNHPSISLYRLYTPKKSNE